MPLRNFMCMKWICLIGFLDVDVLNRENYLEGKFKIAKKVQNSDTRGTMISNDVIMAILMLLEIIGPLVSFEAREVWFLSKNPI